MPGAPLILIRCLISEVGLRVLEISRSRSVSQISISLKIKFSTNGAPIKLAEVSSGYVAIGNLGVCYV